MFMSHIANLTLGLLSQLALSFLRVLCVLKVKHLRLKLPR